MKIVVPEYQSRTVDIFDILDRGAYPALAKWFLTTYGTAPAALNDIIIAATPMNYNTWFEENCTDVFDANDLQCTLVANCTDDFFYSAMDSEGFLYWIFKQGSTYTCYMVGTVTDSSSFIVKTDTTLQGMIIQLLTGGMQVYQFLTYQETVAALYTVIMSQPDK